MGPAYTKEWNSPCSPQGSTSSGRDESNALSNSRPTKDRSSFSVSMQVNFARVPDAMDVLQLSGRLAGDVKELRNGNPTRDLQMAADRTRPHTLCGPVV